MAEHERKIDKENLTVKEVKILGKDISRPNKEQRKPLLLGNVGWVHFAKKREMVIDKIF